MTRYLANRLVMLRNVVQHFDEHPTLWADLPLIVAEVDTVRAARDTIERPATAQAGADTTGLTDERDKVRDDAVDRLTALSEKVRPYARTSGNGDLLKALSHAPSTWAKLAIDTFAADARDALNGIEAVLPDLTPYQVTAEEIAAARTAVADVPRLTSERDTTGFEGEVATDELDDAYPAVRPALLNLDDLVPAQIPDPAFVAQYREARQIPGD
ncbi:hypothetical protein [Rubrivirga sp. IMCC45206]|uniref:hypothetical protein n=1 Tax=Rubrivirga sp. IMCC45206 TaxID=3391614 RepID=UPI00399001BC